MMKFELLKVHQDALVDKITAKHLESVIDVIKKALPCHVNDDSVEFMLTNSDTEALMKEISIIASKLENAFMAGKLWKAYDYIFECLANSKEYQ